MVEPTRATNHRAVVQRFSDLPLQVKLYIGLGALVFGLLLGSGINAYFSLKARELVNQTLINQREMTALAADINNHLLTIQNQSFGFYDNWSLTGFESEIGAAGFDEAATVYLNPLKDQIDHVQNKIALMRQLRPDAETEANLDEILSNLDTFENTLLSMTDQMAQLGYRDSGKIGELRAIRAKLQLLIDGPGLEPLQSTLFEIGQHEQDLFFRSNVDDIALTRESIGRLETQVAKIDDVLLSAENKIESENWLGQYRDRLNGAVDLHRELQNIRPNLFEQIDSIATRLGQIFHQQETDFNATVARLQRQQSDAMRMTIGMVLLALVGGPIIAFFVSRQTVRPIQALGRAAEKLGGGDLSARAPVFSRDEIGRTAVAFNLMADRLYDLLTELELRVAERTHDLEAATEDLALRTTELEQAHQDQLEVIRQLEDTARVSQRRAAQLQAGALISRAVARIRDLDQLLPQVTQLISQHFGFYHVGVFLIDEAGRFAVLRAANSEGGQRLLARQHKLAVGSEGIVGYVVSTAQSRIALDIGADAVFFNNPDLPDTRSEMALPLRVGDEIIGALDVQSTKEEAFDQEDVAALESLADQIAIAIQNARLFEQGQIALEDASRAQQLYIDDQWSKFVEEQAEMTYEYRLSGVPSLEDDQIPEIAQVWLEEKLVIAGDGDWNNHAIDSSATSSVRSALAVPIKVRGQTIGVLDLQEVDDERAWSEDEIALIQTVADQLGQALEGARLFEQSQSSLAATQTLFETSRSLAAAQDVEEIWLAVVDAARQRQADACGLFLFDTREGKTAKELVLVTGWDQYHHPPSLQIGTRWPFLDHLRSDRPFIITDVAQAPDLDPATWELLLSTGFSAFLLQPIAVRGRWFGMLIILHLTPYVFHKTEIDFYRALADQAALALEGHQLLDETQRRAEREQLIRQITDKVRATSDLETILQTTVQELSKAMGLPRAFVRLGTEAELAAARLAQRLQGNDIEQPPSVALGEESDD